MPVRDTSIQSYYEIQAQGLLPQKRWQIYDWLYHNGPATSNQVFQGIIGSSTITNANIPARLHEMREMGVVAEVGTKHCDITKKTVLVYDVTPFLPSKPPKKKRNKRVDLNKIALELKQYMVENNFPYAWRKDVEAFLRGYGASSID